MLTRDNMKSWKSLVRSVHNCFLLAIISQSVCFAQVEVAGDSVFILFEPDYNTVVDLGKKDFYKPLSRYPNDVSRMYSIRQFRFCASCDGFKWAKRSTFPFVFYFSPKEVSRDNWDSEYFDVTMDYFYSREVFDQNWFNNTPSEEIEKILTKAGKNVFLVDKSYLYNGKYIMLRVFCEKNSTNH